MVIKINNKFWESENLDVVKFKNGDDIYEARTLEEWTNASENKIAAWCNPEHVPEGDLKYGKLYNYYAIIDERGLIPDGYTIPSQKDWLSLIKFLEGNETAGRKLKSELVWDVPGENLFSFGAFPVGFRYPWGEYGGDFCGQLSCFWSIDSKEDTHAKGINMQNDDKIDTRDFIARYPKGQGRSIRLIKL
jgi:uncharacterized protein (TIGR02145 family)